MSFNRKTIKLIRLGIRKNKIITKNLNTKVKIIVLYDAISCVVKTPTLHTIPIQLLFIPYTLSIPKFNVNVKLMASDMGAFCRGRMWWKRYC